MAAVNVEPHGTRPMANHIKRQPGKKHRQGDCVCLDGIVQTYHGRLGSGKAWEALTRAGVMAIVDANCDMPISKGGKRCPSTLRLQKPRLSGLPFFVIRRAGGGEGHDLTNHGGVVCGSGGHKNPRHQQAPKRRVRLDGDRVSFLLWVCLFACSLLCWRCCVPSKFSVINRKC